MERAHNPSFEQEIRNAVEVGNPWALEELLEEMCAENNELRRVVMAIVADEYRVRLRKMPRGEALRLYEECYTDKDDANKDWLLGEITEEIIQGN